jgi:hypothetical protein
MGRGFSPGYFGYAISRQLTIVRRSSFFAAVSVSFGCLFMALFLLQEEGGR